MLFSNFILNSVSQDIFVHLLSTLVQTCFHGVAYNFSNGLIFQMKDVDLVLGSSDELTACDALILSVFFFFPPRWKQSVRLDGQWDEADRQLHLVLPHPLSAALHGAQTPSAEARTHRNSDWRKL